MQTVKYVVVLFYQSKANSRKSDQFSKLSADAAALAASNSGIDHDISAWQATQTAVPPASVAAQNAAFVEGLITGSTAILPPYLTQLPSSLATQASSLEMAEAKLVMSDLAPPTTASSSGSSSASALSSSSKTTSMAKSFTNGTKHTNSTLTPTKSKNGSVHPTSVWVGAAIAGAGVMGLMVML